MKARANEPQEDYATIKRRLAETIVSERYCEAWYVAELRREFLRNDIVSLPRLFKEDIFDYLRSEIDRLEQFARPKDFTMPGLGTPRIMSTLGGRLIIQESPVLWSLYFHYDMRNLLRNIVGAEVFPCLHPDEFMVANFLLSSGSTHGWHLDDPAYALILFFEAPPREDGGLVELIPDWREFCARLDADPEQDVQALVERARAEGLIKTRYHAAGDAYLLRADLCLHRVTELRSKGVKRIALNFGYEATPFPTYGQTASILYSET